MNALDVAVAWLDLLASVTLAGGLFHASLIGPWSVRGRHVLRGALAVLSLVLVAELGLNTHRMGEISGIRGLALWGDVAEMRWTRLWALRAAAVPFFAVSMGPTRPRLPIAAFAIGWLLLRSLQGHAGAHGGATALADWVHLSAVAVWLGALVQFSASDPCSRAGLVRLRWIATGAVIALVPTGVYGALQHVRSTDALLHSSYGHALLAKLCLVAPLLAIGAWNHFRLSLRQDAEAAARLRAAVRAELVLGSIVLAVSAWLGSLPMPHH